MNINKSIKRISIAGILISFLLITSVVFAQTAGETNSADLNTNTLADDGSSNDSITSKDITRWAILGGTVPAVYLYGLKTWDWGDRHTPYSKREYWFGEDTSFGGSDKAGHFYAHYMVQRGVYQIFNWTEDGGNMKWPYSIATTMLTGLFIEVGDAYTSAYGFAFEDIVLDYAGILFGAALDYSPILDGFLGFSSGYIPSAGYINGSKDGDLIKYSLDFVNDYSGWQYMFNFKIAGFRNLGFDVPFILRILSIDVGWYTKGYTGYDVGRYPNGKERDIFVGISINSAQLLSEIWPVEHRNAVYTASHTFLEYYHLPYERLPIPTRLVKDLND